MNIYIYIYIKIYIAFKSLCIVRLIFFFKLKYSIILKKGTFCFGHFSSENYDSDNRVCTREIKHGVMTVKKAWSGRRKLIAKEITENQKSWCW